MGLFSKKYTIGYIYRLTMHMAFCQGRIDRVNEIRIDDRQVWVGAAEPGDEIAVSWPDLFGGRKRGGGVEFVAEVMDGDEAQGVSDWLLALSDEERPKPVPGYYGISSLLFRGTNYAGLPNADPEVSKPVYSFFQNRGATSPNWGNSEYFKPLMANATAILKRATAPQWYPEKAEILSDPLPIEIDLKITGEPAEPELPLGTGTTHLEWVDASTGSTISKIAGPLTITADGGSVDIGAGEDGFIFYGNGSSFGVTDLRVHYDFAAGGIWSGYESLECRVRYEFFSNDAIGAATVGASVRSGATSYWSYTYLNPNNPGGQTWGNDWLEVDSGWFSLPAGLSSVFFRIARASQIVGVRGLVFEFRGDVGATLYDINPAHAIREALVNEEWGRGFSEARIGDSFEAAADLFHTEGLGVSIGHDPSKRTAWDLIQRILTQTNSSFYMDRRTGVFELLPIRADYDPEAIPHFTEGEDILKDSIDITLEQTHELINRVVLTYYDRRTRRPGPVEVMDDALIEQMGGVINSTELDYSLIANYATAVKIADRELRQLSRAKHKGSIEVTRRGSGLHEGNVIKVTAPRANLDGVIFRISKVDEGNGLENRVRLEIWEDVFSLDGDAILARDDAAPRIDRSAQVATRRLVQEAPYQQMLDALGTAEAESFLAGDPEGGVLHVAARAPTGAHLAAQVWVAAPSSYEDEGDLPFAEAATLSAALSADPEDTDVTLLGGLNTGRLAPGMFAQVGAEILVLVSIDGAAAVFGRGALDTVPQAHDAGAVVVFWGVVSMSPVRGFTSADVANVKLRTDTGFDTLALADAPVDSVTFGARAIRPYPPGKLQLGGVYVPAPTFEITGNAVLTWAHRDRLAQVTADPPLDFTDASIGPEAGTTYRVEVIGIDGAGLELDVPHYTTTTGSAGATIAEADYMTGRPAESYALRFKVWAVRDGFDSWQAPAIDAVIPRDVRVTEDGNRRITSTGAVRILEG